MADTPELSLIEDIYREAGGTLSNEELYQLVQQRTGLTDDEIEAKGYFGIAQAPRSKIKHRVRWFQQTLKSLGIIERLEGKRGVWKYCKKTKNDLHEARPGVKMLAFDTHLGAAIFGDSLDVFAGLREPVCLCVTSPPYPLRNQRSYGDVASTEQEYIDFITRTLEPIVMRLISGGSIVMNLGQDIFQPDSPARSLYVEKLVIALNSRLGLELMDRIPWVNYAKPPAPTMWACVEKVQLCVAHEPIYWFTNNPHRVRSNNQRVLLPHHEHQKKLFSQGGANRVTNYGDGAYRLKKNSFSVETEGRIPKNVIQRGNQCVDSRAVRAAASALGLPPHPAMFPTDIPDFFIRFLTEVDELVVDPFAGALKTGLAAERLGRRWLCCDKILEWLRVSGELFRSFPGFRMNPYLNNIA